MPVVKCRPRSAPAQCAATMDRDNTHSVVEESEARMGVPHVTSFCWCMGLEMGSKCIGMLHLAASIALLVLCSISAESARAFIGTAEDLGDHVYSTWYKMSVTAAVFTVAHVVLAATLIISVFKRKTVGLCVWVWVMALLWAAALVGLAVVAALRGIAGSGSDIFLAFLAFLEGLLFFGILAYSILCVNSYYLMLRSAEDMQGPGKIEY